MAAGAEAVKCTETIPLTPDVKVQYLRQHEGYCYQVAFYLLNDCKQAKKAAEQALLVLYKQEDWFRMAESARLAKTKRVTLQQALELRKQTLSELA